MVYNVLGLDDEGGEHHALSRKECEELKADLIDMLYVD